MIEFVVSPAEERLVDGYASCSDVKTRVLTDDFDEKIWMKFAPCLEGLDGILIVQGALAEAVVACGTVLSERAFARRSWGKTRLPNQLADAAIEALDHAVGLRMATV